MIRLLADGNIQGHVELLVARMRSGKWKEFWDFLGLEYVTFAQVGLAAAAADLDVWNCCQAKNLILVTDNRNDDGPTSLQATIQAQNSPASLPVFTIGNIRSLSRSTDYAERIIEQLFGYLLELDRDRGSGRLFLP